MIGTTLILLPIIGFIIGLLVSTIGGGGGALYVPILTLLGVTPQVAVATSLATVLPTTAVGAYSYHQMGDVDVHTGVILGIGGLVGTLIGAYIANMIPPNLLKEALGLMLLVTAIPMVKRALEERKKRKTMDKNDETTKQETVEDKKSVTITGPKKVVASLFGVLGGILAGVFGISGTQPVQAGLYTLGLPAMVVIGTTTLVLVFNSIAGIGGYLLLGRFDLTLIVLLCIGTVVGAFLGPKLLGKVDRATVERVVPSVIVLFSVTFGLALIL
jgi:uncharacterized protein